MTTSLPSKSQPSTPLASLLSSRRINLHHLDRPVRLQGHRPSSSPCPQLGGSLAGKFREGITRPIGRFTEDLAVHHYLPGIHGEVRIVKAPVNLLRSLWFVGGIMIGGNIFVSQGFGGVDALAWIKDKHFLEEIEGYRNDSNRTVQKRYGPCLPTGSLLVSFSLNGIRSLLGRLFTNRSVCRNGKLLCVEVMGEGHIFACDSSNDIFGRCS